MSDGNGNKTTFKIPQLDAKGAIGLGEEVLMVAAEAAVLPDGLVEALGGLRAAHTALARADRDRIGAQGAHGEVVDARRAAGAGWRALRGFVEGWAFVQDGGEAGDVARRAHAILFDRGLLFLRAPARRAWVGANQRLTKLAELGVEEDLRQIGGAPFLDGLRAAHERFGDASNMTKPEERRPEILVRPLLDAFRTSLGDYILQVRASGVGSNAAADRAERLLAPLHAWRSRKRRARVELPGDAPSATPMSLPESNEAPAPAVAPGT
jgi:hypothetical protein